MRHKNKPQQIAVISLLTLVSLLLVAMVIFGLRGCEFNRANASEVETVATEPVSETEPDIPTEPKKAVEARPEPPERPMKVIYFDVPLSYELQDHIFALCDKHGVDPAIVVAIIEKESNFEVDAVGDSGRSLGLMQIQPMWFYEEMKELGCDDLLDPYQNLTIGIHYLGELVASGKPIEYVLMVYNGGPTYAAENWAVGLVSNYAKTVMSKANTYGYLYVEEVAKEATPLMETN